MRIKLIKLDCCDAKNNAKFFILYKLMILAKLEHSILNKNRQISEKPRLFCSDGNSYIFSIRTRRNANALFEISTEIKFIFKVQFLSNFFD